MTVQQNNGNASTMLTRHSWYQAGATRCSKQPGGGCPLLGPFALWTQGSGLPPTHSKLTQRPTSHALLAQWHVRTLAAHPCSTTQGAALHVGTPGPAMVHHMAVDCLATATQLLSSIAGAPHSGLSACGARCRWRRRQVAPWRAQPMSPPAAAAAGGGGGGAAAAAGAAAEAAAAAVAAAW
jgi:hypothetical protein